MLGLMASKSGTRERMIDAAHTLYRRRGYLGTSFSDVITTSGAPRGSVAFHFPGGKDELAIEVMAKQRTDMIKWLRSLAAESASPQQLISRMLTGTRDRLIDSDYRDGCPLAVVVIEGARASQGLQTQATFAVESVIETLATLLQALGATAGQAEQWSVAVMTGYEGALVVCKATRSPAAFDALLAMINAHMASQSAHQPMP